MILSKKEVVWDQTDQTLQLRELLLTPPDTSSVDHGWRHVHESGAVAVVA